MEFWSENQGQPHLNSRFGTIPGRNWAHSHHDRHQATHYPVYYGEQQDQCRESSYWAAPGSRTGGTLHEYTHWTDPELTSSSSSQFPFILDRHTQSHQDQGEYQQHEARDKDWATSHRAMRDYERGFLREGWQRRWEPDSPVRYNREFSAKRSDSSYRELEAWAARYSHSLPRRRRIEAELRGASQGLVESSRALERDCRSGTDPQVAALQHVQQNPNSRVPGLWDRGCRQQAPTYYPSRAPAPDTSHVLDMKENTGHQRRIFNQPPGYIAPPPYHSPHKCSPVMQHSDITQEQGGKRQVPWPMPMLRKQDVSKDLQDKRKEVKDESITCPEVEGLKHQRRETGAIQTTSPIGSQNTHIQSERVLALHHTDAVQNSNINQKTTSKIIEGRKFRLNKKTGGMTIFCLVSRIAGATETPSLPLCTPQTNIQSTEKGEVSKDLRDTSEISQMHKLADEVDFRAPTLREQPCASDVRNLTATETLSTGKEIPGDYLPNKAEVDGVSMAKTNINDGDSTFGRQASQSVQPVSVKYPLWREPGSTSRAETQSSPTSCITADIGEEESDDVLNNDIADINGLPIDTEMRTPNIEEDTEDTKDLLVNDTTNIVKMELIPSPKKEHVHYLGSIGNAETSAFDNQTTVSSELNCQQNQDVTTDQNTEQMNEGSETDLDSKPLEKEELKGESEVYFPCLQSSPLAERETLEERAERILGISLHDHSTEQTPKDKELFLDSCVEEPDEETRLSPSEQTQEEIAEEGESQNHLELVQTEEVACSKDRDDIRDLLTNEHDENFAASSEDVVDIPKEKDSHSQPETDEASPENEVASDSLLQSTSETCKHEQILDESQLVDDISSKPPDICKSSSLSLPDSKFPWNILESSKEGGLDPELVELTTTANLTSHPETLVLSMDRLPSPLPSGSTDSSSRSTPHTDHLPSPPPPLDLTFQTADDSGAKDGNEEGKASCLTKNEVNCESVATDVTEDMASQQKAKCHHSVEAADVIDERPTKEADDAEQRLETCKDMNTEVVLPQQLEFVQTECDSCSEESNLIEEQPPVETNVDPTDSMVQTSKTDEENESSVIDSEIVINIIEQQIDFGQKEDVFCGVTEDQSQINTTEVAGGLLEQTLDQIEAKDPQTQIEIDILQDPVRQTESPPLPPALDCEVSPLDELSFSELPSPPHATLDSDTEFGPLLDVNSVCPAAPSVVETVPLPFQLDSCEETTHASFGSLTDSSPVLPPCSAPPPQKENVSPDFRPSAAHKEEPQYPKSLWDVVNRIRKHTAPDSENEEEEVSELWDPDGVGEKLNCPDVAVDMTSEKLVDDEAENQDVLTDSSEIGHVEQDQKEPKGYADEDTMSCSSTSSHGSEDTVIVADEDESEETAPGATTRKNEKFDTNDDREQCFSAEVKDETIAEESEVEEAKETDTSKSGQDEECPVEVERLELSNIMTAQLVENL